MFIYFAVNQGAYALVAFLHAIFLEVMAFVNVLTLYQYTLELDEKKGENGWNK